MRKIPFVLMMFVILGSFTAPAMALPNGAMLTADLKLMELGINGEKFILKFLSSENFARRTKVRINFAGAGVLLAQPTVLTGVYSTEALELRLDYDARAQARPELMLKDLSMLQALTNSLNSTGKVDQLGFDAGVAYFWQELRDNATAGHEPSKLRLLQLEAQILASPLAERTVKALERHTSAEMLRQELERLKLQTNAAVQALLPKVIDGEKQKAITLEKRREGLDLNGMEALPLKLNDLVLRNDRIGVRRMVEAYLPWEIMSPSERQSWIGWLEAIENPDTKNTTLAFRGIDFTTDKVQTLRLADGSVNVAFLSTVLTKNQGSYTRRLRSLSTNRLKNGDRTGSIYGDVFVSKMTNQMASHAKDPKASNFLSFSFNPEVAVEFVGKTGGGVLAVRMDPRRLIPNLSSEYAEVELLAPLIVFPDEVVAYVETPKILPGNKELTTEQIKQTAFQFSDLMLKKTGAPLAVPSKETVAQFRAAGFSFLNNLTTQVGGKSCAQLF